jgi:hypothetical protein
MMMNANLKNQVETFGQFCGRKWPLLCSGDVTSVPLEEGKYWCLSNGLRATFRVFSNKLLK